MNSESSEELTALFEDLFNVRFYIQQNRIYAKERKSYIIERAASGLQTLSWLYLVVKYRLIGEIVLIDEPETSLHPEYVKRPSHKSQQTDPQGEPKG